MVRAASQVKKLKKVGKPRKHPCEVETELDKINSLPRHLIDNILSHLSIRDAVRTSILSRNWRYKWATVPSLVFDEQCLSVSSQEPADDAIKKKLVSIIKDVLLLHKGPILKFKLAHDAFEGEADIDRWIVFLSRSSIREFVLKILKGECYKLPSCLFDCQNLTHLELYNCTLKPPPTFKGFKNLKRLDLQYITIGQDVLENLISSCPLLERLTLIDFDGFTDFNIDAPNLQFIDAKGIFHDVNFKNTFNLATISISFEDEIKHIHGKSKADESSCKLVRFFANLRHIQRLLIKDYFLEYLGCGNIPRSLPNKCLDLNHLSIDINFNDMDETEAALSILRSSPNIRELEIQAYSEEEPDASTYTNLWGDDHWSSLFTHLRVATLMNISGFSPELDFINFILSNAPVLETMTVKSTFKDGSCELLKKLLRFRRASTHVEIIYLDP